MKRKLLKYGLIAAGLGALAFLGVASGIVPIKASSGHWAITAWLLNFAKMRSVATHTLTTTAPPLEDPALVLRGAGHYETGCRPCHGSPEGEYFARVSQAMTPPPPTLRSITEKFSPEELFYIVKHGIKFTGMPGWPTQGRDDEVWAVVAFLIELRNLDRDAYRKLVYGDPPLTDPGLSALVPPGDAPSPRSTAGSCARCHGAKGESRGLGAFPKLAGQREEYLLRALEAYGRDQRHSGIMQPIAAGLSAEEKRALAKYYAELGPAPRTLSASRRDPPFLEAVERGRVIASNGIPLKRVPACSECHGPAPRRKNPAYPRLAGQHAGYLVQQLELFKAQQRGGSEFAHVMQPVAGRLTPEQMRDVAAYYSSLAPSRGE